MKNNSMELLGAVGMILTLAFAFWRERKNSMIRRIVVGAIGVGGAVMSVLTVVYLFRSRAEDSTLAESQLYELWLQLLKTAGYLVVAAVSFSVIFGVLYGLTGLVKGELGEKLRAIPFALPAVFFVFAGLLIPLIRTVIGALKNDTGTKWIWLKNFGEIFTTDENLISFLNTLIWTFVGTALIVGIALAVARYSDGISGERTVKSLIFLPTAISGIGAGIIWKFIYTGLPFKQGLLNQLTHGISQLGVLRFLSIIALVIGLGGVLTRLWSHKPLFGPKVLGFFGGAVGLFVVGSFWRIPLSNALGGDGERNWLVERAVGMKKPPDWLPGVNTLLLIVIFLWTGIGLSTVILSAAIKGVPQELQEAARVDGATSKEIFRQITVPYIKGTIMTVVTLTSLAGLKAFDIVAGSSGGKFYTNTLGQQFYQTFFLQDRDGMGQAIAVLLFVLCFPVLIINRRVQKKVEAYQ